MRKSIVRIITAALAATASPASAAWYEAKTTHFLILADHRMAGLFLSKRLKIQNLLGSAEREQSPSGADGIERRRGCRLN